MHLSEPGTLYRCTLDGLELLTSDATVTPTQLKAMAGTDQSRLVFQLSAHGEHQIAENEPIHLPEQGMERFVSRAADLTETPLYRIQIDGNLYVSKTAHITLENIRQIGSVDPAVPLFQLIHGQPTALQPGQVIDLTQPGTEQFSIHGGHGQGQGITITVNGRPETVYETHLTYDQLIKMAFPVLPVGENVVFTMTYRTGTGSPLKSLVVGGSVHVKEGMSFNVVYTDKS